MNPPTPAEQMAAHLASERTRYAAVLVALNGVADQVPESAREFFTGARTRINAVLAGLPPLEQQAAAQEANSNLDWCASIIRRQDEVMGQLNDMMIRFGQALAGMKPLTALQGMVDAEITSRMTAGELFPKATHVALMGQHRTEVENEFAARMGARTARRTQLAAAGVPAPADESRLDGDDAAFAATLTLATARQGEMRTQLGLAGTLPDGLAGLLWAEPAVYAGQLGAAKTVADSLRAAAGRSGADPLLTSRSGAKPVQIG